MESSEGDLGDDSLEGDESLEGEDNELGEEDGSLEGEEGDLTGGEGDLDSGESEQSIDEKMKENKEKYDLFQQMKSILTLSVKFKSKIANIDSHENSDEVDDEITYIKRKLNTMGDSLKRLYQDFETLENTVIKKILNDCKKELVMMVDNLEKLLSKNQKTKK